MYLSRNGRLRFLQRNMRIFILLCLKSAMSLICPRETSPRNPKFRKYSVSSRKGLGPIKRAAAHTYLNDLPVRNYFFFFSIVKETDDLHLYCCPLLVMSLAVGQPTATIPVSTGYSHRVELCSPRFQSPFRCLLKTSLESSQEADLIKETDGLRRLTAANHRSVLLLWVLQQY